MCSGRGSSPISPRPLPPPPLPPKPLPPPPPPSKYLEECDVVKERVDALEEIEKLLNEENEVSFTENVSEESTQDKFHRLFYWTVTNNIIRCVNAFLRLMIKLDPTIKKGN